MPVPPRNLTPAQAIAAIRTRVRSRITALEGVRLPEYSIALYELRVVEDLLIRAESYLAEMTGGGSGGLG